MTLSKTHRAPPCSSPARPLRWPPQPPRRRPPRRPPIGLSPPRSNATPKAAVAATATGASAAATPPTIPTAQVGPKTNRKLHLACKCDDGTDHFLPGLEVLFTLELFEMANSFALQHDVFPFILGRDSIVSLSNVHYPLWSPTKRG